MAAPIISISSYSSKESVGSHATRVILFGAIPAIIPVISEVPIVPAEPIVTPEVGTVQSSHLSGVASRPSTSSGPSSHDILAPSSEFPLAPIVALPGIRRRSTTLILPGERHVSHHSSNHHSSPESSSSSSYSDPSSIHSSGCDSSGQAHSGPSTRDAPPRLIYPPVLTPRYSEAFRRWRATPLSTPYLPTTSESSLGSSSKRSLDSSLPSSGPSRKRCRSPTASVPSPTHVSRSIALTSADLLPPCKRFRGLYSSEDSGEEHMEVDTADAEAVADVGISGGIVAHTGDGVGMRVEIAASDVRDDDEEFEAEARGIPDLEDTIYDIVHYMSEVRIDRITEIETTQRQLETSQLVASGERASLVERIGSLRLEYLKVRAMLSIERDRIDSLRWHMALSQEEFRQVRRDRDDTRRRLRRLESYVERHLGFRP
ncbi:hypothetical protein Tco_0343442 [Tanacetum coccineum]